MKWPGGRERARWTMWRELLGPSRGWVREGVEAQRNPFLHHRLSVNEKPRACARGSLEALNLVWGLARGGGVLVGRVPKPTGFSPWAFARAR